MEHTNPSILLFGWGGKMGKAIRSCCEIDVVDAKYGYNRDKNYIVVDFSSPQLFDKVISAAENLCCPVIIGTTGLSQEQQSKLSFLAKKQTIVYESNFSIGILAFKLASEIIAKTFKGVDTTILETHHRLKKDKPSGTAKSIKSIIDGVTNNNSEILSIRGGDIKGTHEVFFIGQNEVLSIKHEALDRNIFAQGVILAINWIVEKKSSHGLFSMRDILL